METPEWLMDPTRFASYQEHTEQRLRVLRDLRTQFLEHAATVLDGLLQEARLLRADELCQELESGCAAAQRELAALEEARVWRQDSASTTDEAAAPQSIVLTDAADPDLYDSDTFGPDTTDPEMSIAGQHGAGPVATDLANRADPSSEVEPLGEAQRAAGGMSSPAGPSGTASHFGTAVDEGPQAAPVSTSAAPAISSSTVPPRAIAPSAAAATPPWIPRERVVVDREVEQLGAALRAVLPAGASGLLQLKAVACRLRRAYAELDASGHYLGDVKAVRGAVQARLRDEHGDPYAMPLDTSINPDAPAQWEKLAVAYEGLVPAVEAFDWFNEHATELRTSEAKDLLDTIGAAQQRLFRLLSDVFHAGDDQQKQLYADLRTCAEALTIYLDSLHPEAKDQELERSASRLEKKFRDLRTSVEKRLAQERTLAALLALLDEPRFGTRDEDVERVQAAAAACLEAGVPKTKPELRNTLLEWEALLEGDERLRPLLEEIGRERERRSKRGEPIATEDERVGKKLTAELEKLRQELLPLTRGKRCLFVGGHVRAEYRERIEKALELETLEWPETDRFDASPHTYSAELKRSDIVVLLIRFLRTGMKRISEQCREEGKAVVRLPRGLNVARVVTNFHEQLVPRR